MQLGIIFISYFFKEFVKRNFYVYLLQNSFWLTSNFVYVYNFFCLYEDWFALSNYSFSELSFRFIEIVSFLTVYVVWP
jgi:hypothetical protein